MSRFVHRFAGFGLLWGVCCFAAGSEAKAGFLYGQTMSFSVYDSNRPATVGPYQFVVNNTVELGVNTSPAVPVNIEVDDTTITFTYTGSAAFNGPNFNGYIFAAVSPTLPAFGSIMIDPATTLANFKASDLSFDSTHFYINVASLSESTGTVLKLDVGPVASAVPEPSSLVLCGIAGLTWVGVARLRRRRPAGSLVSSLTYANVLHC